MRVLLVEDHVAVGQLVANHLEREDVVVTVASTMASAAKALLHNNFEVVILDLTLPDGSGLDVLRTLREDGSRAHVIVLSGAGTEVDRVRALDLGADDYVVKPFFVRELAARTLAVRRRQDSSRAATLDYGTIRIDLIAREVTVHNAPVGLPPKEFDLLAFLAGRPREVFSRDELLRSVWQSAGDWQQEATVTEHICRLRYKIELDPLKPRMLCTARGAGYRFDPPAAAGTTVA